MTPFQHIILCDTRVYEGAAGAPAPPTCPFHVGVSSLPRSSVVSPTWLPPARLGGLKTSDPDGLIN